MNRIESNDGQPWYRQLWPWLLMLPPFAAVLGGFAMLYLAASLPNALVVDDYARIEDITREQFARDARADALGVKALLELSAGLEGAARISVVLESATAEFSAPTKLVLQLRHATNEQADRKVVLDWAGARYSGVIDLTPGRYRLDLMPADGLWRLGGSLTRWPGTVRLLSHADGED